MNRDSAAGLLILFLLALTGNSDVRASEVSSIALPHAWHPLGEALVIEHDALSGITYVGGSFTEWGELTGPWAALDESTGGYDARWPSIKSGSVDIIISDGAGGYYLGGHFLGIGEFPRRNLAHVRADRTVDPDWTPDPNDGVSAMVLIGETLYVGGTFSNICGVGKLSLAAIDGDGDLLLWNPAPNGPISDMVENRGMLYVGGSFSTIGGVSRNGLAAVDVSGLTSAWNPNPSPGGFIASLSAVGNVIYVAGPFTTIGGSSRNNLAAIDATTGVATVWNPDVTGVVWSIIPKDDGVIVGGFFSAIGGIPRNNLARIDTSGIATAWDPSPNAQVNALADRDGLLYVGGQFTAIDGSSRRCLALFDETGSLQSWAPNVNSQVQSIVEGVDEVMVGGFFNSTNVISRNKLAAIDSEGVPTSWNPNVNGDVRALSLYGGLLYVGGIFTEVGGQPRKNLAAIDLSTAVPTAWDPGANNQVIAMAEAGGVIYIGGSFSTVAGQARANVAALDTTGAATSWAPNADGTVRVLSIDGGYIYVGGKFTHIAGESRGYLAQLTPGGVATSWNPDATSTDGNAGHIGEVTGFGFAGGLTYVSGYFDGIGGASRVHLAAIDVTGTATAFNPDPTGGDAVLTMTSVDGIVYAMGNFTVMDGQVRRGGASFDGVSGDLLTWNPGHGAYAMESVSGMVYAGGAFRGFFSMFPENALPVIEEGASVSVVMDEDESPTPFMLTLNGADDDGDLLTWAVASSPNHGETVVNGTGSSQSIGYVPSANYSGSDTFTVSTNDGRGGASTILINVVISPRNDPPVNVVQPSIVGAVEIDHTLEADVGTWGDTDDTVPGVITYEYQWQRADDVTGTNVADIGGANGSTYIVSAGDLGYSIRLKIIASDNGEGLPTSTSAVAYSDYSVVSTDATDPIISMVSLKLTGVLQGDVTKLFVNSIQVPFDGGGNWTAHVVVPVGTLVVPITTVSSAGDSKTRSIQLDLSGGG